MWNNKKKTFHQRSEPLRKAVAYALLAPELDGIICTFEQLLSPLCSLGGCTNNDDVAIVTKDLIQRAHRQYSGSDGDHFVTYESMGIDIPGTGGQHFLLIRNAKRVGSKKIYEFCHLKGKGKRFKVPKDGAETKPHPLDLPSVKRAIVSLVPKEVQNELKDFLQSQKKGEKQNATHAKEKKGAREEAREEAKAKKDEKKQQQQAKRDAAKIDQSTIEVTPPPKKVDNRKKTWPQQEVMLSHEIMELKAKIARDGQRLQELTAKLNSMTRERSAKQNQMSEKENTENASDPPPSTAKEIEKPKHVHYTFNGRAGKVKVDDSGVIFFSDMVKALEPLTPEMTGKDANGIRRKRRVHLQKYGKSHAWAPAGTELVGKNYLAKLKKSAEIVTNLKDLLDAEKCVISKEGLSRLAAWCLHNFGGSDGATQMAIAGTLDMLFHEIGFEYDAEQLGKAVPSERTIAQYELNLATDSLMKVLQDIKDDGAKHVGIMCDHGHRGGQDHFVIVIVWSGYNKDGSKTLKFFCPSIDSAGHTAVEAAEGVKTTVERFLGDESIKVQCILGDRGGGAAVQYLYPELKILGVMDDDSNDASCTIHGIQKALENASIKMFGDQGLGSRTPFQMLYVFASLMKKLREIGDIGFVDTLWAIVQQEIQENPEWQSIASRSFRQAWKDFIKKVESFDEMSDKDVDDLLKFMTESPRNIQDPVWTRWGTVIKTAAIFLDNYVSIYFLCVGVKSHFKSDSDIWKRACALISLMNERAVPNVEGGDSIEHFINSMTEDDRNAQNFVNPLQEGESPTFYTMLLFHRAFCEYTFNDNFGFLQRNDLYFGIGTFGQLARFMAERAFVMHKQLQELKNGGWKEKPQFVKYVEALKGIPKVSDHGADLEFFLTLPDKFINLYEKTLTESILDRWRNSKLVSYQLGGQPELAKEFAASLVHHRENVMGAIDNDGDAINAADLPKYQFTDKVIELDDQHKMSQGKVKVNVKERMEYVVKEAALDEVVNNKFVEKHWDLIVELAAAEQTVHLFELLENGSIDKSTWNGIDFTPLVDDIWRVIAIHSHHQQRCENYVQMAAVISKTLVCEARRTWRGICTSAIMRPFNMMAVETVRATKETEEEKKKVTRVRDRKRVELFTTFLDEFRSKVRVARAQIDDEQYKTIYESIEKRSNKVSLKEQKAHEDGFERDVKKEIKTYKKELESGYELTAYAGGKVELKVLTKTGGHKDLVHAELIARKIPTELNEFIKEYGENAELDTVPFLQKKYFLKLHEAMEKVQKNKQLSLDDAVKATSAITPVSVELIEFLDSEKATIDD